MNTTPTISSSNKIPKTVEPSSNILFKGWILLYQNVSTSCPGTLADALVSPLSNKIKWIPKFAIVNKNEKTLCLYDQEPVNIQSPTVTISNETNSQNNLINSSSSSYRLDSSIRRELFVNYWTNKCAQFDSHDLEHYGDKDWRNYRHQYIAHNRQYQEQTSGQQQQSHHHLSNKDIERLDKELLVKNIKTKNKNKKSSLALQDTTSQTSTTSSNSTFRFANLFFKKDKSNKQSSSSNSSGLKRAKSGIQLERRKQSSANTAAAVALANQNEQLLQKEQLQKEKTSKNKNPSDFDKRQSLPSPMRPSRSHESLSSAIISNNGPNAQPPQSFNRLNQVLSSMKKQKTRTSTGTALINNNLIKQESKSKSKSKQQSNRIYFPQLNLTNDHLTVNDNFNNEQLPPVYINAMHASLLNEENCFQVKCFTNIQITTSSNSKNTKDEISTTEELISPVSDEVIEQFDIEDNESDLSDLDLDDEDFDESSSSAQYQTHYFLCRSSEERDKWIQCLRLCIQSNCLNEQHEQNSLQMWIQEAKCPNQSTTNQNKRYFCEILFSNLLHARTCVKERKDLLFWGESFDFNLINVQDQMIRVELYQETDPIHFYKKKNPGSSKYSMRSSTEDPSSESPLVVHHCQSTQSMFYFPDGYHTPQQQLIGHVQIPIQNIESSQPIERWYRVQMDGEQNNEAEPDQNNQTTVNFGKDSFSIRIKAKYQSVNIQPLFVYKRLIDFINQDEEEGGGLLPLLLSLESHLNVKMKDELSQTVVRVTHRLHRHRSLLVRLVLAEVLQLEDSSLCFRGNSLATKAMECYMKLIGDGYLRHTLSDCVRSIMETSSDLEIDPSKVSSTSTLQLNREELLQCLHLVCGRVFNSCSNVPLELRHVFSQLRSECLKAGRSDQMCDTLISASLFLRFLCPAILSPNLFGLVQEYPGEKAARKLTLVAKILQTIANFSKFGGKEVYMSFDRMNVFVDEHTELMREFLRSVSTLIEQDRLELVALEDTSDREQQMLRNYLKEEEDPMLNSIVQLTPPEGGSQLTQNIIQNQKSTEEEFHFQLSMLDLGKQLSILHSLLTGGVWQSLDERNRTKLFNETHSQLNEILNQLTQSIEETKKKEEETKGKLYSYENRLHYALLQKTKLEQPGTAVIQSNGEQSININEEQQKRLEFEINELRLTLKSTEQQLQREQQEKQIIEQKLRQQQLENDEQMRSIISRLIKVEEELRKEQTEMHKLLKTKQDLIDIQKKRIEYLTQPKIGGGINESMNKSDHLHSQHPSLNQNQHQSTPIQSKQQLNRAKVQVNGSPRITKAHEVQIPISLSNGNISHSMNKTNPKQKPTQVNHGVAASPSSSASSMTQFCSYLVVPQDGTKKKEDLQPTVTSSSSSSSSVLSSSSNQQQSSINNNINSSFLRTSEL